MHRAVLVYQRRQVHRVFLKEYHLAVRKALAQKIRQKLINAYDLFVELFGFFAARVKMHVGRENRSERIRYVACQVVQVVSGSAKTCPSLAAADAVKE